MRRFERSGNIFRTPFCKDYWVLAFREFKDTRMLVFAALILALRLILKPFKIPIYADLNENIGFIINAFGSMVYGPVVALLSGALSDTLGFLLFPSGVYFPPFMITEMAGSFVFALFLYRTEITVPRLLLARFSICFFVNSILSYPIWVWYYSVALGKEYPIAWIRLLKNIAMFPIETVLLVVIFRSVLPPFRKLKLVVSEPKDLDFTRKNIILLSSLFVLGAGLLTGFGIVSYNTTSLSASYTAQQRLERNRAIEEYVLEEHRDLNADKVVSIIESAYPKAFSPDVTYTVAVYKADLTAAEDKEALMTELEGLSKSKAAKREELTFLFREDVVLNHKNAKEPEKGRE